MADFIDIDNEVDILGYFYALRSWHAHIRLLDLVGNDDTSFVPIDKLFVEPGLASRQVSPNEDPQSWPEAVSLLDALTNHQHLVILGDPGTGKSTIVSWITSLFGTQSPNFYRNRLGPLVPVPIVLRDLDLTNVLALNDLLDEYLSLETPNNSQDGAGQRLGDVISKEKVIDLMARGQALLILDGLDEVASNTVRAKIREIVHEAERQFPELRVVITSRIVGYEEEPCPSRINFEGLYVTRTIQGGAERRALAGRDVGLRRGIQPLVAEHQVDSRVSPEYVHQPHLFDEALEKPDDWNFLVEGPLNEGLSLNSVLVEASRTSNPYGATLYMLPFDDARVEVFSGNWHSIRYPDAREARKQADEFVNAVRKDGGIWSLGRIPNLLTFMALVHKRLARLPDGRANLYKEIADAYLDSIDLRRKLNGVPYALHQKKEWLGRIAFMLQRKRAAESLAAKDSDPRPILISRDELKQPLLQAMRISDTTLTEREADEFIDYIARRSGLLIPRSSTEYAFVHLSFQEYFAALELCRIANRDEFLATKPKWQLGKFGTWSLGSVESAMDSDPPSVSRALPALAHMESWAETLLLALEADPPRSRSICLRTFGPDGEFIRRCLGKRQHSLYVKIASRALADDFNGLEAVDRRALLEACCEYHNSLRGPGERKLRSDVLAHLFGEGGSYGRDAVQILSEGGTLDLSFLPVSEVDIQSNPSLSGLTALKLIHTQISDLSPLSGLTSLQSLEVIGSPISDLTPLSGLNSLHSLGLNFTSVRDLSPLSKLTSLRYLSVDGSQISDLSPLAELTSLEALHAAGNMIGDLTPLSGLVSLRNLSLSFTTVSDFSPLSGLRSLESFFAFEIPISDLSPLSYLTSLQTLILSGDQIRDLSPLCALTSLKHLALRSDVMSNLSPLSSLTSLRSLTIGGEETRDLSPLCGLTSLQKLNVQVASSESDLSPLTGLTSLRVLHVGGESVLDLTPISGLASLQRLSFDCTSLGDITPLLGLSSLQSLTFTGIAPSRRESLMLRKALPKCEIKFRPRIEPTDSNS